MYPEKFIAWCGLWAGDIIGPYFFKDATYRNVTVNGERYGKMISNLFSLKMQELDLHDMWRKASLVNILFHIGRLDRAI